MISILSITQDNLIAVTASGKLEKKDYNEVFALAEKRIAEYGKIKFYLEIESFEGISVQSLWEEVKFDFKHFNDMEKIAVVGEKDWQHKVTMVMKGLTTAEVQYFDHSEKVAAINWVKE
jgi:hypothetical protein